MHRSGIELDAAARALLRLAYRFHSRVEFLSEASQVLLRRLEVDELSLLLQDGPVRYHWRARTEPSSFRLVRLTSDSSPVDEEPATASDAVVRLPFEVDPQNSGVLWLRRFDRPGFSASELRTSDGLAQLLGAAMAVRRAQLALAERVKELTCMYSIAQIAAEPGLELEATLHQIVALLPPAWQYPERTTARIVLDGQVFETLDFRPGPHRLQASIHVGGAMRGAVEVFYVEQPAGVGDRHLIEEMPFLTEERSLIQGVARELAFIIERKQAEREQARLREQIRHADRLATIGQLAAGVAHELNEPLGNILGFAQLAEKTPQLPEAASRDLGRIVTASLYAREVIRKLMLFSRQEPSQRVHTDICQVARDALSLLETRCVKGGIRVQGHLPSGLPLVAGDPAQLQQVLVNLIVNGIQAMPDGGTLRVEAVSQLDDHQVRVVVADEGVGMTLETQRRVFLPFFTTKDVGQGTGLGLSVAHGIVTAHGGTITVRSAVGEGSRFEVRLPARQDREEDDVPQH